VIPATYNIEHIWRKACFKAKLAKIKSTQRGTDRRLEYHSIVGCDCGSDFMDYLVERMVKRGNRGNEIEWNTSCVDTPLPAVL